MESYYIYASYPITDKKTGRHRGGVIAERQAESYMDAYANLRDEVNELMGEEVTVKQDENQLYSELHLRNGVILYIEPLPPPDSFESWLKSACQYVPSPVADNGH